MKFLYSVNSFSNRIFFSKIDVLICENVDLFAVDRFAVREFFFELLQRLEVLEENAI